MTIRIWAGVGDATVAKGSNIALEYRLAANLQQISVWVTVAEAVVKGTRRELKEFLRCVPLE